MRVFLSDWARLLVLGRGRHSVKSNSIRKNCREEKNVDPAQMILVLGLKRPENIYIERLTADIGENSFSVSPSFNCPLAY